MQSDPLDRSGLNQQKPGLSQKGMCQKGSPTPEQRGFNNNFEELCFFFESFDLLDPFDKAWFTGGSTGLVPQVKAFWSINGYADTSGLFTLTGCFVVEKMLPCESKASKHANLSSSCLSPSLKHNQKTVHLVL